MDGHLQHLLFNDLLEPGFVQLLVGRNIDTHDQRAVILGFQSEYALPCLTELKPQIIQVEFIIHLLGSDGKYLEFLNLSGIRAPNAEVRRHEYFFLNLLGGSLRRVVADNHSVAAHECLYPVYSTNLLHPCLESHGTAVAFDGSEVFYPYGL